MKNNLSVKQVFNRKVILSFLIVAILGAITAIGITKYLNSDSWKEKRIKNFNSAIYAKSRSDLKVPDKLEGVKTKLPKGVSYYHLNDQQYMLCSSFKDEKAGYSKVTSTDLHQLVFISLSMKGQSMPEAQLLYADDDPQYLLHPANKLTCIVYEPHFIGSPTSSEALPWQIYEPRSLCNVEYYYSQGPENTYFGGFESDQFTAGRLRLVGKPGEFASTTYSLDENFKIFDKNCKETHRNVLKSDNQLKLLFGRIKPDGSGYIVKAVQLTR